MQGIEQPVPPHSVNPFSPEVLERLLYPAFAPQPEGTARVTLSDDYYLGPVWGEYRPQSLAGPEDVFDIPAEQRDRWQAAMAAYDAMQAEIEVLMQERREDHRRHAEPVQRGPYIPQP